MRPIAVPKQYEPASGTGETIRWKKGRVAEKGTSMTDKEASLKSCSKCEWSIRIEKDLKAFQTQNYAKKMAPAMGIRQKGRYDNVLVMRVARRQNSTCECFGTAHVIASPLNVPAANTV